VPAQLVDHGDLIPDRQFRAVDLTAEREQVRERDRR